MKKRCVFCSFLLIFLLGISATAAEIPTEPYSDAGALYQAWNGEYPDYISGVWSTDGGLSNLTFGIVESADFEAIKSELLALVKNDNSITFVQQKYARNYLTQIQEELYVYFENYDPALGLSSMGVYEMENYVGLDILEDKKEEDAVKNFLTMLNEKYGDAVQITYSAGIVSTIEEKAPDIGLATLTLAEPTHNHTQTILLIGTTAILACTVGGIAYIKKRKLAALQTATGQMITNHASVSTKQTENAIKTATLTPNCEIDKRILDKTK